MDALECMAARYSCRSYQDKPVKPELLEQILEAARLAPSASNRQEWRFIIVTDPEKRAALVPVAHKQEFVGQRLTLIACLNQDCVYIPNRSNYGRGGYETTPRSSPYSIETGNTMLATVEAMLSGLLA